MTGASSMVSGTRLRGRALRVAFLVAAAYCTLSNLSNLAPAVAEVPAAAAPGPPAEKGFMTKIVSAAAQGCTAATVAAILSAFTEPLVNRLLVKRMTFGQAFAEMTFAATATFFLTTFPTNMLKFPVFEVINMILSFTSMAGSIRGIVNGFLFCTIMLPVTNYRFRK
eukprot:CAMPEP_0170592260 /NCGR_PEP_ID=MMETSP0224-20130122/12833_1 /TAXON_ID=285029 /ORGANISM="Togula jolla, Strain CCCM 725" /LENGTH=166 /DNA_ID=CAMNT_0010916161 /DNA_START=49 /DNA_END=546 /DNA_ORIENTATION=+